jgi:hypothetical protein
MRLGPAGTFISQPALMGNQTSFGEDASAIASATASRRWRVLGSVVDGIHRLSSGGSYDSIPEKQTNTAGTDSHVTTSVGVSFETETVMPDGTFLPPRVSRTKLSPSRMELPPPPSAEPIISCLRSVTPRVSSDHDFGELPPPPAPLEQPQPAFLVPTSAPQRHATLTVVEEGNV